MADGDPLLMITGFRQGEIVGLKWEWVNWEGSTIRIDTISDPKNEIIWFFEKVKNKEKEKNHEDSWFLGTPKGTRKIKVRRGLESLLCIKN